jgi:hypothetical protein
MNSKEAHQDMKTVVIEVQGGIATVKEADPNLKIVVWDIDKDGNPYCTVNTYYGTEVVEFKELSYEEVKGLDGKRPTARADRRRGYRIFNETDKNWFFGGRYSTMRAARARCRYFRKEFAEEGFYSLKARKRIPVSEVHLTIHTPGGEEVDA